jgi:hypothetical protein
MISSYSLYAQLWLKPFLKIYKKILCRLRAFVDSINYIVMKHIYCTNLKSFDMIKPNKPTSEADILYRAKLNIYHI